MTERTDHLTDEEITRFLLTRSADAELGLLDDIVRTVGATPQDRPWLGLRPNLRPRRIQLIVPIALLLADGAIGVGSAPSASCADSGGMWPQSSLRRPEARARGRRRLCTPQVDPQLAAEEIRRAEILARFSGRSSAGKSSSSPRCQARRTSRRRYLRRRRVPPVLAGPDEPLVPDGPRLECATIDEFRYETVSLSWPSSSGRTAPGSGW
jgi:hypothetical protein